MCVCTTDSMFYINNSHLPINCGVLSRAQTVQRLGYQECSQPIAAAISAPRDIATLPVELLALK